MKTTIFRLTAPDLAQLQVRLNSLPAMRQLGVSLRIPECGVAEVELECVKSIHLGGLGDRAINGMTLMGMADAVMCASVYASENFHRCATASLEAKFIRPAVRFPIRACGAIDAREGSTFFCSTRVLDGRGRVCLQATARIQTFKKGNPYGIDAAQSVHTL